MKKFLLILAFMLIGTVSVFANNTKEVSVETSYENTSMVLNSQASAMDEAAEGNGGIVIIIDDGKSTTIIIIILEEDR